MEDESFINELFDMLELPFMDRLLFSDVELFDFVRQNQGEIYPGVERLYLIGYKDYNAFGARMPIKEGFDESILQGINTGRVTVVIKQCFDGKYLELSQESYFKANDVKTLSEVVKAYKEINKRT